MARSYYWWDILNLVPEAKATPLRATEPRGRKLKEKKLFFGGKSLIPADYVPPKKQHQVVFDGKTKGRQLNVRNFNRHFALFSPTEFNEECVDMLETLGEYKKPGWYTPFLASAAPVLVEHHIVWERFEHEDGEGGVIAVDWAHPPSHQDQDEAQTTHENMLTPVVVIVPGLAGHSGKDYIRSVTSILTKNLGWRVCVLNWRGFNAPLVSNKVFQPHDIADTELFVENAHRRYPAAPLFGIGFSAGSNQLLKYLGKHGEGHRIIAAMSVCNGFEYGSHLKRLEDDPLGAAVYSRGMTYIHQEYLREHGARLQEQHPELDLEAALNATKHSELDLVMVRTMYGFDTLEEYHAAVCCRPYIPKVKVPLLCLQSRDDPLFTPGGHQCYETLPVDELHDNKNIVYFESEFGSHLNFVEAEARNKFTRESYTFCDRTAEAFFDFCHSRRDKRVIL